MMRLLSSILTILFFIGCAGTNKLASLENSQTVFFRFDSSKVLQKYKRDLDNVVVELNNNRNKKVIVEGHTDILGASHYNDDLGDQRARAIKSYLISKGVFPKQIMTISYGESEPTGQRSKFDRRVQIKDIRD